MKTDCASTAFRPCTFGSVSHRRKCCCLQDMTVLPSISKIGGQQCANKSRASSLHPYTHLGSCRLAERSCVLLVVPVCPAGFSRLTLEVRPLTSSLIP